MLYGKMHEKERLSAKKNLYSQLFGIVVNGTALLNGTFDGSEVIAVMMG